MTMTEAHWIAKNFDAAFSMYQETIQDAQRAWTSRLLLEYPNKEEFARIAERTRRGLTAMAVEVNSLGPEHQTTVASAPSSLPLQIPLDQSLCVLGLEIDGPVQVSDIQGDPFVEGHNAQGLELTSWMAVPVIVQDMHAGSVCALETVQPRIWSEAEQKQLQRASEEISTLIDEWFHTVDKTLFL